MATIEPPRSVTLRDFQARPMETIGAAADGAVAVVGEREVVGYVMSAAAFEAMMDRLDDIDLAEIARSRMGEEPVSVSLDEL